MSRCAGPSPAFEPSAGSPSPSRGNRFSMSRAAVTLPVAGVVETRRVEGADDWTERWHGARVIHVPLQTIPTRLVEANQQFRFLWLTERQWKALVKGVDELRQARAPGSESDEGGSCPSG